MEIKAIEVKKLRDKTGAGMMDCKRALQEAQGDAAKALKILKELGLAAAAKRAGRATNEGRVATALSKDAAAYLELLCETDFVAKNEDFKAAGVALARYVMEKNPSAVDKQMEEIVGAIAGKIKENITIRRFQRITAGENEFFSDYIHGEGKIGVIVKLSVADQSKMEDQGIRELAFNLALHIAAFSPLYLSEEKIDAAYIKEQEEIFIKQSQALGKPENVTLGIAKGKLKKHFAEICLMDQGFVKDEKLTVHKVIEETGKAAGTTVAVTDFLYVKMGEDLE